MSRSKCNGRESTTTEYEEQYAHTPYSSSYAWVTSPSVYSGVKGHTGTASGESVREKELARASYYMRGVIRPSTDEKGLTRYFKSDEYKIP